MVSKKAHPSSRVILGDARRMPELRPSSVELVVTSPPYYSIKDYGVPGQIGFGQNLHAYLRDLYLVWKECARVLTPKGRLCINVGDQFARSKDFGRYKVIPLHAEIIAQCEQLGFDYLGSIIWQKKTTMRTSGGAVIMGSFPYPPNGVVELDYEYILIFRSEKTAPRGDGQAARKPDRAARDASRLTRDEWKEYFRGHWQFAGKRKKGHGATFPIELPRRLIRMFSLEGDTVLDPFLGSGTTLVAALELNRCGVGYEIQEAYRAEMETALGLMRDRVVFAARTKPVSFSSSRYKPGIADIEPLAVTEPEAPAPLARVKKILSADTLVLADGRRVRFLGLSIPKALREKATAYLGKYLRGQYIYLKDESAGDSGEADDAVAAYVYLKNRLFVNRKMLEMGLATAAETPHRHLEKFKRAEANYCAKAGKA